MRFQNFWEDFVDFLDSVVSQTKRILFDSNKIGRPVLSYSELTTALIKKETRLQNNRVSKKKKQQTMENQMWQSYKLKGVSGSSSDMVLRRLN